MKKQSIQKKKGDIEEAYAFLQDVEKSRVRFDDASGRLTRAIESDLKAAEQAFDIVGKKLRLDDQKFVADMDSIAIDFLREE